MSELPPTGNQECDSDGEGVRVPVRHRWLKRFLKTAGAFALLLIAVRIWWGWAAERSFRAELDRIAASGEPIFPRDFDPPTQILDEDNAAIPLKEASRALSLTTMQEALLDEGRIGEPSFHESHDSIAAILEANEKVFALMRQARDRSSADWGFRWRSPMASSFSVAPSLSEARALSKLLRLATEYHIDSGNTAAAIDCLDSLHALSRKMDEPPLLINHLVVIAIDALATRTIERILPLLRVPSRVSRIRLIDYISRLGDTRNSSLEFRECLQVQRAFWVDTLAIDVDLLVPDLVTGLLGTPLPTVLDSAVGVVLRPIAYDECLRLLSQVDELVRATESRHDLESKASRNVEREKEPEKLRGAGMGSMLLNSVRRSVTLHDRCIAERRMAATALAIRLYELDRGHRPPTLGDLLPMYLQELLVDPFGDGEQTFGYLPNAPRPRLYSRGHDGIDDGGRVAFGSLGGIIFLDVDIPFFLDGSRPRSAEELNTPVAPPLPRD